MSSWQDTVKKHKLKRYEFHNKNSGSPFWVDAPTAKIAREDFKNPKDWKLAGSTRKLHDQLITGFSTESKKKRR